MIQVSMWYPVKGKWVHICQELGDSGYWIDGKYIEQESFLLGGHNIQLLIKGQNDSFRVNH